LLVASLLLNRLSTPPLNTVSLVKTPESPLTVNTVPKIWSPVTVAEPVAAEMISVPPAKIVVDTSTPPALSVRTPPLSTVSLVTVALMTVVLPKIRSPVADPEFATVSLPLAEMVEEDTTPLLTTRAPLLSTVSWVASPSTVTPPAIWSPVAEPKTVSAPPAETIAAWSEPLTTSEPPP
jgi:hypothetical protein